MSNISLNWQQIKEKLSSSLRLKLWLEKKKLSKKQFCLFYWDSMIKYNENENNKI